MGQRTMIMDPVGELRHLRNERSDWLLTVLTGVLILLIFVFAPLQAVGITAFHLFTIGLLLAIIGSMVIISNSPTALILMSVALVANIAVFFLRLYYPVPFHLHILAGAFLLAFFLFSLINFAHAVILIKSCGYQTILQSL